MRNVTRKGIQTTLIACLLAFSGNFASANPEPQKVHLIGPFPAWAQMIQCEGLGPDPIMVEAFIEELWGHFLGEFNEGFDNGSGGVQIVQPARWVESAQSLGGSYTWLGRTHGTYVENGASNTARNIANFNVRAHLHADGDWPSLLVKNHFKLAVTANGDIKVFDAIFEVRCVH